MFDTEEANKNQGIDWLGIGLLTAGLASLQYVLEEGQREDWFQSTLIVQLSFLSGIALVALIVWQLLPQNKNPVINLRVLGNASVSAGIVLFIVTGFGLYGVTYLYPLLAQTLHGLSSLQTGLVLLPGGIATAVSITYCGAVLSRPGNKIDPRFLILIGILCSVVGMWMMAHLTPQSRSDDVFWPLLIRGFSIGFLMIPVNQAAIGSMKKDEVVQGVALLGLGRQLGGSFGIAILATYVSSQTSIHRAYLVEYLSSDRPAVLERLTQTTGGLVAQGYSFPNAQEAAFRAMDQIVNVQALAKSYNSTFMLLLLVSLATAPAVFLLRKPAAGAEQIAVH